MKNFEKILESKERELIIYSPYNFIRNVDQITLTNETLITPLLKDISEDLYKIGKITVKKEPHFFIYKKLEWDTKYFGFPVYNIHLILYNHENLQILNSAILEFAKKFIENNCYWFINVPCEDILLVQALCSTTFRLVETRLNLHLDNIQLFESEHYPTRLAEFSDSQELRRIAIKMRNKFDRVHADPSFSIEQADAYLGTFAEETIKGFTDFVIVPDVKGMKPFGFLAGNKPVDIMGIKIAKLVLTAVDNSIQRGWLYKLLIEMIFKIKQEKADYITTITQAANKPSIHVWEKAGFKLSSVTHIFSTRK